ncbi:ATP-binding protein [Phytopseudomonas dryadis]|uniref:histidine kinase n=1 Tax=Phytopseudomonas dryadis TaxID=2487520 RepID=A0A4Q9QXE0_9GAMM|nr:MULTISPECIES: ATP-binding protein [Pseudomonas]TBU88180.1 hybrid sensor histidine kinase/response regulator [Pseudomonas dryadis]TBV05496.1 hybrid sensor histidine kinase/response regulator [Pseudomonas dryadis]TBV18506.1 hybrid sensor histidine kinase/response regulator [Pseudomonas sp. FRB 230]
MSVDRSPALRVLICAPYGRDAASVATLLEQNGYATRICASLGEVAEVLDDRVGVVLATEEAFAARTESLQRKLEAQAPWSDVPFVLLAARQGDSAWGSERARLRLPRIATNTIVLERPLSSLSLLSSVASALRGRQKQFQIRDQLRELADSRQALLASESELRLITDSLPVLVAFIDKQLCCRFVNRACESWFDLSPEHVLGRNVQEVIGHTRFDQRLAGMQGALAGVEMRLQVPWPRADGRRRVADVRYLPRRDGAGEVDGFHVFVLDITDSKKLEEGLRDTAELLEQKVDARTAELHEEMASRAQAEAALRQSQKMEAVGQLTGGIAHDFNNMLTGIIGAIDIMKRRIASGRVDDLDRFMDAATISANRAAGLTQRLLTFSRRQSLEARPIDVHQLLGSLEELIRRTVNERIVLHMRYEHGLALALADANQLESAILNLTINARDAMPFGGQLQLHTSLVELDEADIVTLPDLQVGRYLLITLTDSGSGMSAEVLEKVFDPFFTTKPVGQGTGLGLSMVYGFARQSGGQVTIHSEPGAGTTVRLYLPAVETSASHGLIEEESVSPSGRGQRVLLVEDDAAVRLLVAEVLDELGYDTVDAAEPQAAIALLASDMTLDMLVSDVGLPGMSGRQLAEIARQHRPELPILFVTGYADHSSTVLPGSNMDIISKPFSMTDLANKLSDMLATKG